MGTRRQGQAAAHDGRAINFHTTCTTAMLVGSTFPKRCHGRHGAPIDHRTGRWHPAKNVRFAINPASSFVRARSRPITLRVIRLPKESATDACDEGSRAQPTQVRALRNIRNHGPSSPHALGYQEFCTVRYTRSGCGIMMVTRPSALQRPVIPCGAPLGLAG